MLPHQKNASRLRACSTAPSARYSEYSCSVLHVCKSNDAPVSVQSRHLCGLCLCASFCLCNVSVPRLPY